MLSIEEVLGRGLDLNLGDGKIKGDVFGEVLDLAARVYLRCFCVVGRILSKSCVVYGDTIVGAATGFGVDTLGSLKMGGCCYFSAEWALEKI